MRGKGASSLSHLPAYQRPPAEKIGKYKILGTLGRGGMGIVYKGLDPDIEREVAIKTIRLDDYAEGPEREEMLARVVREAKAAGRLNHPNIITIYDVIHEEGLTFIVMQCVDGQSLQAMIDPGKRFSPREAIEILKPVADALDYAHQNGIVHRDIKPANILIDRTGRPYLADFGVARMEMSTMTGPGKTIGTLSYMAPEQIMGGKVDHRADIFALGVIVYELLTGKKPFAGDNISTIVYKIVNEEPQHITDINRELPRGYEDVIKRALAKNPDERYQSGRAMMADLEDPDKFAEATRAYGAGTAEPEKTPAGKRWRFALAGGLLVFAVLAVVGYQLLSRGGGTSKAGGPVSKSVKRGEISPGTRPESPPLPPAISRAEENLAKLKASFEHKNYDETVDLAKKMLGEDPTDAAAREYRDKALEARLADQVAPILEAGIADYDSGRYQACVDGMERVLKLDKNNAKARDYLNRADSAVSRKDIEALLEEHRAAEESQELLTIINHLASPALVSEAQSQYKDWFNGYDGITSRTGDLSVSFRDRWNATATFTQWVMGTGRKDRKKTMLFSGQKSWDLKKANGSWKIVNIR